MLKIYLAGLFALTVPASLCAQASSVRQEIMLERASAPKLVEVLRARFPGLTFILHPTMNGFYAVGPRADTLAMRAQIPELDDYPEEIVLVKYGDLEEIRTLLQTLVPDVSMKEGELEQTLVLKGSAGALEQAKELLDQLDRPPDQVVLECKLLKKLDFPVNWHSDWEGRVSETGQVVSLRLGDFERRSAPFALFAVSSSDGGVLASPRIALNSDQTGQIHIGDKISTGSRYQDVGLKLETTLKVEDQVIQCQIQGEFKVPLETNPGNYIRSRTLLFGGRTNLKDGKTLILDGLLPSEIAVKAGEAIPLLCKLPILGNLFRNTVPGNSTCIMITPNLMR